MAFKPEREDALVVQSLHQSQQPSVLEQLKIRVSLDTFTGLLRVDNLVTLDILLPRLRRIHLGIATEERCKVMRRHS